eukprot:453634-Pelagomonas_calceolata.AAC.1
MAASAHATLELQLKFVRELKARLSDEDYVPIAFNLEEDAEEAGEEEEEEGEAGLDKFCSNS